jgi:hypothetical protein
MKKDKKYSKETEEIVDNLTLFDDQFMARVFDQNKEATQLLLSIILNQNVEIKTVEGQDDLKNPVIKGRGVKLDVLAKNTKGDYIDIEVQRDVSKASVQRARFYSAMVDSRMLKEGDDFKNIRDSIVLFICEKDKFKRGKAIYKIERKFLDNNDLFNDGNHIIYVNGEYDGNDALGKLIHDFKCKDYKEMYYKELREGVKYFKEEEGREEMCESIENYANKKVQIAREEGKLEGRKNGRIEITISLINDGILTVEDAAKRLEISVEELESYMK